MLELARTMLSDSKISDRFWSPAISFSIHMKNKGFIGAIQAKLPMKFGKVG